MNHRLLFLLAAFSLSAYPQPWSTFLDRSRAIDWTNVGFTIPNYTANCPTQPSLTANDPSSAGANTSAIQNALASCDATHNVVNIPAGQYYVAGWMYGSQGHQVLRGAGPMSTTIVPTAVVGCGYWMAACMFPGNPLQGHSTPAVLPPSGKQQCAWTGGLTQGSTTITLSSCGSGPPPMGALLILDQANDSSDTGGVYNCDPTTAHTYGTLCENKTPALGLNSDGRLIAANTHSEQQVVRVTGVTNNADGTYALTIARPVYFNNIRAGQSPGAWWVNYVQNDGLENLTVDHSYSIANLHGGWPSIAMLNCYQCWIKNVRHLDGGRSDIFILNSLDDVIRDNYFYKAQGSGTQSYGIEFETASGVLVENNIFQQLTVPIVFGQGSGNVVGYNYMNDTIYINGTDGTWMMAAGNYAHNSGNEMNLWEGNNLNGINCDGSTFGPSALGTLFRNRFIGWQSGKRNSTYPISLEYGCRGFNVVGNVIGQPKYHNNYESYSTSTTTGVNGGSPVNTSIYSLGWTGINGPGGCSGPPACDPLVRSTLMRWGNYDTVTNGTKWDSTEASPSAVPYIDANFTSSYFSSLAHALPASLYYASQPSWWPTTKAWPPIGPDVSAGNLGICSGTYSGAQATASGQCAGGTWSNAWAAYANSIPAQDCYLNVMHGSPDGTGNVLNFDASLCYASYTGGTLNPCDLNGDGVVNCADLQIAINQVIGISPCTNADLQDNGTCTVIDVQRIINAIQTGVCKTGP